MIDTSVVIPIVANTTGEGKIGTLPVFINVDPIIKANPGGLFSLNSVGKIKVERVDLTINNPDWANNLASVESDIIIYHVESADE